MARQKERDKGKAKKESGVSIGKLIARIALYGFAAAVFVLIFLEFRARSAAGNTGQAWREAFRAANEGNDDFLESQLDPLVKGNPKKETRKAKVMGDLPVAAIITYKWSGIFRDYNIYIGLGLGQDPTVEVIEGPGSPDPLAGQ